MSSNDRNLLDFFFLLFLFYSHCLNDWFSSMRITLTNNNNNKWTEKSDSHFSKWILKWMFFFWMFDEKQDCGVDFLCEPALELIERVLFNWIFQNQKCFCEKIKHRLTDLDWTFCVSIYIVVVGKPTVPCYQISTACIPKKSCYTTV